MPLRPHMRIDGVHMDSEERPHSEMQVPFVSDTILPLQITCLPYPCHGLEGICLIEG